MNVSFFKDDRDQYLTLNINMESFGFSDTASVLCRVFYLKFSDFRISLVHFLFSDNWFASSNRKEVVENKVLKLSVRLV